MGPWDGVRVRTGSYITPKSWWLRIMFRDFCRLSAVQLLLKVIGLHVCPVSIFFVVLICFVVSSLLIAAVHTRYRC